MKIWVMHNPQDERFADATLVGTWEPEQGGGLCPECTADRQHRVKPLILEWEPGSDQVGDFTWALFGVAITERVCHALQERFRGFEPGPVEFWENPKLKKPTRVTKRTNRRIWLPYSGPPLYELWVTRKVPLDLERSTVRLTKTCSTCGRKFFDVWGLERRDWSWDPERLEHREWMVSRVPGEGIIVRDADLAGAQIFDGIEAGRRLCTDPVKEFIEQEGFTNVTFREMGEVI